jgi:PadR family transcriptional regulator AphA
MRRPAPALAFLDKMPRVGNQLAPGEWAVLALLAEGPTHGFAIARAMAPDGEIGKVWSLPRPRVYHAIDALIARGFARPVATVASSSGPHRTLLEVTEGGPRALTTWLAAPVEHVRDARSLLLLKLRFLDRSDLDPRGRWHRHSTLSSSLLAGTAECFKSRAGTWRMSALVPRASAPNWHGGGHSWSKHHVRGEIDRQLGQSHAPTAALQSAMGVRVGR